MLYTYDGKVVGLEDGIVEVRSDKKAIPPTLLRMLPENSGHIYSFSERYAAYNFRFFYDRYCCLWAVAVLNADSDIVAGMANGAGGDCDEVHVYIPPEQSDRLSFEDAVDFCGKLDDIRREVRW